MLPPADHPPLCKSLEMAAGTRLLEQLLRWPALMLPSACALMALLQDVLTDAASLATFPPPERAALYQTVAAYLRAFGVAACDALAPAILLCAWAECYAKDSTDRADAAAAEVRRPGKKARTASTAAGGALSGAAVDATPPEHLAAATDAQVCSAVLGRVARMSTHAEMRPFEPGSVSMSCVSPARRLCLGCMLPLACRSHAFTACKH